MWDGVIHLIMQNMHGIFMETAAECAYGVRSVKCQHLVIYPAPVGTDAALSLIS